MTTAQLAPALIVPLVAWRMYVRVRRNIGKQPLEPRRLKARVAIFAAVTLIFVALVALHPQSLLALLGGVAGSGVLAWFGIKLTRFERTPAGDFYTPNTAIGVVLSLLLVGRLVYRFVTIYPLIVQGHGPGSDATFRTPLTMAIFGLTFGYYVIYYAGVLYRSKHLDAVSA